MMANTEPPAFKNFIELFFIIVVCNRLPPVVGLVDDTGGGERLPPSCESTGVSSQETEWGQNWLDGSSQARIRAVKDLIPSIDLIRYSARRFGLAQVE